ncbi:MAG: histidine phosphatase family protein [Gallionellaceae bacterium]|jgi:phosphohistidine phosphatase
MELILWRHAEAVESLHDASRALTDKGKLQAERMAGFLSSRLPPNTRILVSPAVRAQQTAGALSKKFITEPALNTGASAQAVLEAASWPHAEGAVLLVGHQPWLGEVAAKLMIGKTDYWSVKKGAVWWFSNRERNGEAQTVLRLVIAPEHV